MASTTGVWFPESVRNILLSTASRSSMGPIQSYIQWEQDVLDHAVA
jgi:hypothetical protein